MNLIVAMIFLSLVSCTMNAQQITSIHQFKVEALDSGQIDLSIYKGKKILIVNTASRCGYTSQYKDLETLYNTYKDKLVVIGFPANNFGGQEPGTNEEIKTFCTKNYGVSFPMAAKISVKGKDIHPLFDWLTQKAKNGVMDASVNWNFTKFLIDENGVPLASFPSRTNPMSEEITSLLK